MGLDVYLYRFGDFAASNEAERKYEAQSDANWEAAGSYDELADEQKDVVRAQNKALASSLGLDEWGTDVTRKHKIEQDSGKHPQHMYKIGYFRSSYNSGGINHILADLLSKQGLYYVFDVTDKTEYYFRPDWALAKRRAEELIAGIDASTQAGKNLRCEHVDHMFATTDGPSSTQDAIAAFLKVANGGSQGCFSMRAGMFFVDGLSIVAAMPGVSSFGPCTYLVYRNDLTWYRQALEIVAETCDWALAQPDIDKLYLAWSS